MGRTKQGGSILGYVIVGGVLIVLLLAGAYALRNYWSGSKPAEVAQQPSNKPKPQSGDTKSDKQGSASSNTPTQPSQQSSPSSSAPAPAATQLPQTGPADTLFSLMILAIIMTTAGVYLHSRRLEASL